MNTHKNGTIVVGAPHSYQWYLSAFKDSLKGKGKDRLKDFEAHMFREKIRKTGLQAGLTIERMTKDWNEVASLFGMETETYVDLHKGHGSYKTLLEVL